MFDLTLNKKEENNFKLNFDLMFNNLFDSNNFLHKYIKIEESYKTDENSNYSRIIEYIKFNDVDYEIKCLLNKNLFKIFDNFDPKDFIKIKKIKKIVIENSSDEIFLTSSIFNKYIEEYDIENLIIENSFKSNQIIFDKIFNPFFLQNKRSITIQSLSITNCNLTSENLPNILNLFNYSNLNIINLSNNLLDYKSAIFLYLFFSNEQKKNIHKPKNLILAKNNIGDKGFSFIINLIGIIKSKIDLSENNLSDESVELLNLDNIKFYKNKKNLDTFIFEIKNNNFNLKSIKNIPNMNPINIYISTKLKDCKITEDKVRKIMSKNNSIIFE